MSSELGTNLWVFGYGSLCWQPGFNYRNAVTGYVKGYSRKFWQGNDTHRGTATKPGRVATLIQESDDAIVWGKAFEVVGEAALSYLNTRECTLGGYLTKLTTFYPHSSRDGTGFPVLLYIATPENNLWLGEAPLPEIANQIVESRGNSGHNVEYLIRLAAFMRDEVPEALDEHLFTLEFLVRSRIKEMNLNIETLLSDKLSQEIPPTIQEQQEQLDNGPQPDSFQYTAHVPEKSLRCLKM